MSGLLGALMATGAHSIPLKDRADVARLQKWVFSTYSPTVIRNCRGLINWWAGPDLNRRPKTKHERFIFRRLTMHRTKPGHSEKTHRSLGSDNRADLASPRHDYRLIVFALISEYFDLPQSLILLVRQCVSDWVCALRILFFLQI